MFPAALCVFRVVYGLVFQPRFCLDAGADIRELAFIRIVPVLAALTVYFFLHGYSTPILEGIWIVCAGTDGIWTDTDRKVYVHFSS